LVTFDLFPRPPGVRSAKLQRGKLCQNINDNLPIVSELTTAITFTYISMLLVDCNFVIRYEVYWHDFPYTTYYNFITVLYISALFYVQLRFSVGQNKRLIIMTVEERPCSNLRFTSVGMSIGLRCITVLLHVLLYFHILHL